MTMGMGVGDLQTLLLLKQQNHISAGSSIVEIGAQQLNSSLLAARSELDLLASLFDKTEKSAPCPLPIEHKQQSKFDSLQGAPLARDLWQWLGLHYASIDLDGSPQAIPLDLNFDEVPVELKNKFNLVTNLGTTEHVANQAQAFKVIHDLCAVGGVMMHNVPTQGHFNHGLISYHPRFFWLLARSNGYRILHMDISRTPTRLPTELIDAIMPYNSHVAGRFKDFEPSDCGLATVFLKQFDTEYVPPLDIATGAETDIAILKHRYWSVFKPEAFRPAADALDARVRAIYDREQAAADALDVRVRAIYDREQAAASRERGILFRGTRKLQRIGNNLRAAAFRQSPNWVIALKRKLLGVTPT